MIISFVMYAREDCLGAVRSTASGPELCTRYPTNCFPPSFLGTYNGSVDVERLWYFSIYD